ncbi:hypothetical protein RIR_jg6108.t1 [Rhizophagus irregularis DAOM 181602=DAOM 197198]|nr:hypothetical protein RIR_jg6108.t1 [Rhizophagus irregularis DAOM 181602=DAOM 197198]
MDITIDFSLSVNGAPVRFMGNYDPPCFGRTHGLSESRGYEEVDNEDVKTFITSRESTMEEIRGLCPVSLNVIEKKYHILAAGISYLS